MELADCFWFWMILGDRGRDRVAEPMYSIPYRKSCKFPAEAVHSIVGEVPESQTSQIFPYFFVVHEPNTT